MKSVVVLGRQPALGLAELESLYGADKVRPIGAAQQAAEIDVDPCLLAFDRLGGSLKFCKLLSVQPTTNWKQLEKYLVDVSPEFSKMMPPGKMQLGLSQIGFDISLKHQEATGLNIKKAIRSQTDRPVRLIPNKLPVLSSPQVIHNHLTGPNGWELVLIKDEHQTLLCQTVKEQDIESYTHRDRNRPKRDAKVGMLPPKLAQIIINLAAGPIPEDKLQNICDIPADEPIPRKILNQVVLDPFCGTGVLLQEAQLMGYGAYGTDLEPRMIDYSRANLQWLEKEYGMPGEYELATADATNATWDPQPDFVAAEAYLGRPFTERPTGEILAQTAAECNLIIRKFLRNIHGQLQPGARLCIAIPAWQVRDNQFKHLPLLDSLEEIGYNRVSFEHAGNQNLLYYREDQIVARELLVLIRK